MVRRTPPAGRRARLIIVDDHRMVVRAFTSLLERHFEIVGTAHGGDELRHLLPGVPADALLLDLEMPDRSGYQLIPEIHHLQPALRILVVTMLVDRAMAEACIRAGANGFIPKNADTGELRLAIREVLAGRLYVSPLVPRRTRGVGMGAAHAGLHRLTRRQEQIVLMIGEGRSGVDIGAELGIGPSTVTFHKQNIMRTLGVVDEAELLRIAVLSRAGVGVS